MTIVAHDKVSFWGFSSGGLRWHIMALPFYFLMGLYLLIGGLANHRVAPFVTGLVITSFLGFVLRLVFRPALVIADQTLQVPRGTGKRTVPVADISGIGLIYRRQPYSPGWRLMIWDAEGKSFEIRQFLVSPTSRSRPVRAPGVKFGLTVPLPSENIDRLAASKPGAVAERLYAAAIAVQGPHGRLATEARQKTVEYDPRARLSPRGWWSPDGSMGRAKGMPPADPSTLADPSYYKA